MTKQELATEILNLCLRINNETGFCAFFRYSGHVDNYDVQISKGKKSYNDDIYSPTSISVSQETLGELSYFLNPETIERYQVTVNHDFINWDQAVDASALRQTMAQLESLGVPAKKIQARLIKLHRVRFQDQDFYSDEL
jgi:hypothetical protein